MQALPLTAGSGVIIQLPHASTSLPVKSITGKDENETIRDWQCY